MAILTVLAVLIIAAGLAPKRDRPAPREQPTTRGQSPAPPSAAERHLSEKQILESDAAVEFRTEYAKNMERSLLEDYMDMTVSAEGPKKTTLRIQWVRMSRPLVYNFMNNSETTDRFRALGFKKVLFTDGYNSSWLYDLTDRRSGRSQ
jgi:hypothetical protein